MKKILAAIGALVRVVVEERLQIGGLRVLGGGAEAFLALLQGFDEVVESGGCICAHSVTDSLMETARRSVRDGPFVEVSARRA